MRSQYGQTTLEMLTVLTFIGVLLLLFEVSFR